MKTIKQVRRQAKQLFRLCQVNGSLDQLRVRKVVEQILDSKRRGYLSLANQFARLVRLEQLRHTAKVESAMALPPDIRANVESSLAQEYGADLNSSFIETPELIGGMRIRVGSDIYDGSVRAGLNALEQSF